jgi:hypothetical protein
MVFQESQAVREWCFVELSLDRGRAASIQDAVFDFSAQKRNNVMIMTQSRLIVQEE